MLTYILIALAVLVVILILFILLKSPDFRVARSATMSAPASTVFELVNDFRNWREWSPWEAIDPQLKRSYEGSPAGQGAIYAWAGNNKVGEGRMTIIESRNADLIRIKLEFIKPFPATNETLFTFEPKVNQTAVNWTMSGKHNFVSKIFCTFMNMDKMVGGQFEQGLGKLKGTVERAASKI
jgi:hypothetical protein